MAPSFALRLLPLAATGVLLLTAAPAGAQIVAADAPDWNRVFDRSSGWTGADGIYSIPVDGFDRIGAGRFAPTMFVFSDTFIGQVDAQGRRQSGTTLVNNSLAWLPAGAGADPAAIVFWWRGRTGTARAAFLPETPNAQPDEFYWMKDGLSLDGTVHLFAARFSFDPPPFSRKGVALISFAADTQPPFTQQKQVDAPLWAPENARHGELAFGGAVLDNSVEAGAPHPDGHVYVYGVEENSITKKAIVARVPRTQFTDFRAWRFWDGIGWSTDLEDCHPIAGRVSTEMSVTPLPDGRFAMVFMLDTISNRIAVRIGDGPQGPWGPYQVVHTVSLPGQPADLYTYHAKAHPALSEPGSLLVSYNVNTLGPFQDHFRYADIYRPRFIRLTLQ